MNTTVLAPPAIEDDICDEELMASICKGDPESLSALYDRYASVLKALIVRVVNDDTEADDLLQEIFMQVWKQAEHYDPKKGKVLGWLVTLARRRAIDRLRRRQAYSRAKDRLELQADRQPQSWSHVKIDEDINNGDLRSLLQRLISTLPAFQQEAVELAFFRGMSQREISRFTGTPLGTVKTRLELALRKLTAAIEPLRDKI
ncbi:MAG: sigma-70 family RNA polymerase sigma factor [Verrucomicrobiota bacterium]|nr:sigma-70 family RNA polymerase sigma factor [Verrucomicrobiota bacterium]